MTRTTTNRTRSNSRRRSAPRQRGKKTSGSSNKKAILLAVLLLLIVGGLLWLILGRSSDYEFRRADLERYVESQPAPAQLGRGATVYADMSDGMLSAYGTAEGRAVLQAIINKLAANNAIEWQGLADGRIYPLTAAHTELYNYMMNPGSYRRQQAPIEKTLDRIVERQQPALLMTDFEEYKGTVIEQAAYAKRAFIVWLGEGYNITFFRWPYREGAKEKNMYLAVFDENCGALAALVENAVRSVAPDMERFVLGGRDFAYPMFSSYPSLKQGGNYHNEEGRDGVTAVLEDGSAEAYYSWARPYATATGEPGTFASLEHHIGTPAEYYPLGVSWADAVRNARQMQEPGVKPENRYEHLLTNLLIIFGAQDGYVVDDIEVRVFDIQDTVKALARAAAREAEPREDGQKEAVREPATDLKAPEVNEMLTASWRPCPEQGPGAGIVSIDFDERFDGSLGAKVEPTDLLQANVVISKARPNMEGVEAFFSIPGNPSLANSVKEALAAHTTSPVGRVLYTYYLKTL